MKNCFNCGAQIADELAVCGACGTRQPVAAPDTNSTPDYYHQGSYTPRPKNTMGLAGFILGIASLVLAWIPLIGLGCAIAGLVCSLKGRKLTQYNTAYAVIGLILSIIGGIIGVLYTIALIVVIAVGIMSAMMYW
ncbi:MAG: hypothetical protein IJD17_01130 [Clostridia bacterium]|nr:hypothetical protein [Clostridia bacterium]